MFIKNMEKIKAKVHMLPTEDYTGIILHGSGLDLYHSEGGYRTYAIEQIGGKPQHLYFTTDEKPKEGDNVIVDGGLSRVGVDKYQTNVKYSVEPRKIVATTDKSLKGFVTKPYIHYGSGKYWADEPIEMISTSWDSLPQPTQLFIEEYCKVGGIDEVLIEYEVYNEARVIIDNKVYPIHKETVFDTKYKLKVDSHNTITIHPIKDSWNRKEVINLFMKRQKDLSQYYSEDAEEISPIEDWIKENL